MRGGLLFAVFAMPVNMLLFKRAGIDQMGMTAHMIGTGAFMLVSAGIGWIRDLNHRVHEQARALPVRRQSLKEEVQRRRKAEEKFGHEALHNPLTGLPNRWLFYSRLEHASARSRRNPDNRCAVCTLIWKNSSLSTIPWGTQPRIAC